MSGLRSCVNKYAALMILACPVIALAAGCGSDRCTRTEALGNLGPMVNSPFDEYAPALSDSSTLVFTSSRLEPGRQGLREQLRPERPARLFYTLHLTDHWQESQPYVLFPDDTSADHAATISFAPARMAPAFTGFVTLCRNRDCDVFAIGSGASGVESFIDPGPDVNSKAWDAQPCVTPDGSRLYFASDRPGGLGGSDIWYVDRLPGGFWSAPRNAGARVNTEGDELSPFFDGASGRLYFAAANGASGLDIFYVVPSGSDPRQALPGPYNSSSDDFTPYISGSTLYVASNRPGGCGGYDLYGFWFR